jgi:hypothetical protein
MVCSFQKCITEYRLWNAASFFLRNLLAGIQRFTGLFSAEIQLTAVKLISAIAECEPLLRNKGQLGLITRFDVSTAFCSTCKQATFAELVSTIAKDRFLRL